MVRFLNSNGDGLIVFRYNDRPKNVQILQNTLVTEGFRIRIDQPESDYRQVIVGNAVFAGNPLVLDDAVEADDNCLNTRSAASAMPVNITIDLAELDLYPREQTLCQGGEGLPGFDRDDARPR